MRIGFVRHFPVSESFPIGWRTASDLSAWVKRYDAAETIIGEYDPRGCEWSACISSDQPRAFITAETIYAGAVERTPLLREPDFAPFQTGNLRLPVWAWRWLLRLCWMTGHSSQRDCRDAFRRRIQTMADRLAAAERNTLVVSHAGVMAYLSAELRRRGFHGPPLRLAKHATLYVYERGT